MRSFKSPKIPKARSSKNCEVTRKFFNDRFYIHPEVNKILELCTRNLPQGQINEPNF